MVTSGIRAVNPWLELVIMAEGTRSKALEEKLNTQEGKLIGNSEGLKQHKEELSNRIGNFEERMEKIDLKFEELKQIMLGMQQSRGEEATKGSDGEVTQGEEGEVRISFSDEINHSQISGNSQPRSYVLQNSHILPPTTTVMHSTPMNCPPPHTPIITNPQLNNMYTPLLPNTFTHTQPYYSTTVATTQPTQIPNTTWNGG